MAHRDAYIIAARRTVLGRVGGLHARRRIEDLAAPIVQAVLCDGRLDPRLVDGIVLGNTTEGANPARLIALAAGLPESADASTIDRECASGLDAIVAACRAVACGDHDVVVAGGAEALSTAPWRVARPRHVHGLPRFLGLEQAGTEAGEEPPRLEASGRLASDLQLSRGALDQVALRSHTAAIGAREAKRFVAEIVPLRSAADEARDELVRNVTIDDLADEITFNGGPQTPGNTSQPADGAAIVIVVAADVWRDLGAPKALRYVGAASLGVSPERTGYAAITATERLIGHTGALDNGNGHGGRATGGFDLGAIAAIETSEVSAAEILAFARHFGLDPAVVNRAGGAIARGHPIAAAGAVLVVRLFSDLVRGPVDRVGAGARGLATLSAAGGLGAAALFEAT